MALVWSGRGEESLDGFISKKSKTKHRETAWDYIAGTIWMEYHNSVSEGGVGGGVLFLWSVSVEVVVVMWTEIEEKT